MRTDLSMIVNTFRQAANAPGAFFAGIERRLDSFLDGGLDLGAGSLGKCGHRTGL